MEFAESLKNTAAAHAHMHTYAQECSNVPLHLLRGWVLSEHRSPSSHEFYCIFLQLLKGWGRGGGCREGANLKWEAHFAGLVDHEQLKHTGHVCFLVFLFFFLR